MSVVHTTRIPCGHHVKRIAHFCKKGDSKNVILNCKKSEGYKMNYFSQI